MPLVVGGCARRKRQVRTPIPAMELYEGGCIPQLRRRLGDRAAFRHRVRILSAEHGLIDADRPLLPYDRVLTHQRAIELRPRVTADLRREIETAGLPKTVLLAAEPRLQALVTDPLAH